MDLILILKAIALGIVEGFSEFLPISSTGHLILFGHFIKFTGEFANLFEVVIQLGAILSVVFYYRIKIMASFLNLKPGQSGFRLWSLLIIAFLPAGVMGLLLNKLIDKYLFSPLTVSCALIFGGVLMLLAEKYFSTEKAVEVSEVGIKRAIVIGFSQCLSLVPGMSRSASTIMGGMVMGLSVKSAAEFSFFLSIPTMFAATGYKLIKGFGSINDSEWIALAVGFVVSFIVAFFVVKKFLEFLGNHSLRGFAYYRFVVGGLILISILI